MNFAPYNNHTNTLFYRNQILKLEEIIKIEQLKLAFQFKKNALPIDLLDIFQCNENIYNTRNMMHGGLKVPKIKTVSYGDRSLRYNVPTLWNDLMKDKNFNTFKNINQFKRYLKNLT